VALARGTRGSSAIGGPPRRHRRRRIALVVLLLLAAVVAGIVLTVVREVRHIDANIARTDPFAGLTGRPAAGAKGTQNFLLIGSDSRDGSLPANSSPLEVAKTGGQRSDTLILLHLDRAHDHAYLISIPRDSYVVVPAGGPWDGGRTKINAAFAYGGAKLTVRTVEGFTDVRIDHVVLINFAGFQKMTDALGGVDVRVDKTVYDPRSLRTFRAGVNHLDGKAALDYVRQRYNLPRGDFDREQRQQQFLLVLLKKATDTGTLANPKKLTAFLDAASRSIIVDKQLSVSKTAVAFRGLRASKLTFVTTPNVGSQNVPGAGSVVRIDRDKALALFDAVRKDTLPDWLRSNPANVVTSGP
jgi:LCP family protein required for cell wall assembly